MSTEAINKDKNKVIYGGLSRFFLLQGKIFSRRINFFIYGLREFERSIHCESNSEKIVVGKRSSWRNDAISDGGGRAVVHAEGTSNNEVIVNDGNYSINGTTYTYTGYFSSPCWAGGSWGSSEDANNNTFTFNGGTNYLENLWAGYSPYGNVSGNTLNLYGGEFPITNGFYGGSVGYGIGTGSATNNTINIGTKIVLGNFKDINFMAGLGLTTSGNVVNIIEGADVDVSNVEVENGENYTQILGAAGIGESNLVHYSSGNSVNITGGNININEISGSNIDYVTATVTNNSVNISNGTVNLTNNIHGGLIYKPNDDSAVVSNNKINISGGTVNSPFIGGGTIDVTGVTWKTLRDSYDAGTADNNEINLTGGNVTGFNVTGGSARIATNNKVNITGGNQNISLLRGGYGVDEASGNEINISTGTIGSAYGGFSIYGNATNNEVNISGGTINGDIYGGGTSSGSANNNVVNISENANIEFESEFGGINGGYGSVTENNEVNISGGTINLTGYGIIRGSYGNTSATGNKVNITGGNIKAYGLIGGGYGTVTNNTVNISGGTVTLEDEIRGGEGSTVTNNTVNISGGTVTANAILGGFGGESSANNTVNISGGVINANIFAGGGYSSITDNTINIYNNPDLSNAWLYGGYVYEGGTAGNALNIYTKNLTAKNIYNFDAVNFYLDKNISNGDTMLTLTEGNTDVTNTDIKAVVQGGSPLTAGDSVTLLTNSNGVTAAKSYSGTLYEGISLTHNLNIYRNDAGTSLIAALFANSSEGGNSGEGSNSGESGNSGEGSNSGESGNSGEGGNSEDSSDDEKTTGSASNNVVTVTNSNYTINDTTTDYSGSASYVYGGVNRSNSVEENALYGGYETSGNSSNNNVNINGGTISNIVYGGYTESGDATNNTVTVNGGTLERIIAARSNTGNVSYNNTLINGGTISYIVDGGYTSSGDATNNTVTVNDGTISLGITGAYSAKGNVTNNSVVINGGNVNEIEGGSSDNSSGSGIVSYNSVEINGGTISGEIKGGYNFNRDVTNNTITIKGGTINSDIYGGYVYEDGGSGNATDNTINIYNNPNLTAANLFGGFAESGTVSGNSLNIYTKNLTAQNIYNFDNINFYLQNDVTNGDTLLTLTDSSGTDLSGVAINAGVVSGNSNLVAGDTINLLTNPNGLTTDSATSYGRLTEGVSLDYGLTLSNSGNSIVANVSSSPNALNSVTESLPLSTGVTGIVITENVIDSKTLPENSTIDFEENTGEDSAQGVSDIKTLPENSTVDFEKDTGEDSAQAVSDIPIVEPKGWEIFANMGGGSLRTKAGNGSYVDMTSQSINLGFARSFESSAGKFTIAPIIDYARGNYDSYLIDGTHGSGSTKYIAGGFIARRMLQNGFYYETSFRAGKVKTDFASSNIDKTGAFGTVSYDTSATALSGHLKLGKAFRLNKNNLLDVYGIYSHAHQGGMSANLSSGEHYNFSSANSGRFRIGYRLSTRTSKISRIYTGLAFQYEHASGITATYKGYKTPSAGDDGSSGMLELGWIIKPLKVSPWAVDINATGWIGHQRGVTAFAKVQKAF